MMYAKLVNHRTVIGGDRQPAAISTRLLAETILSGN